MQDLLTSHAWIETLILGSYFVTVGLLSVFGTHRLVLMFLYFKHRDRAIELPEPLPDDRCPTVLVQLPIFNERFVVERLVDHVAAMDWPADRLRVQILDDSTDDTVGISRALVEKHRRRGLDIELIHREDRTGFKAGALAHGLRQDSLRGAAEFVCLLDADFVVQPEFLRLVMPPIVDDDGIGMVQARWGHLNRDASLLCKAQAVLLDGHFIMEHGARFRAGRFFNFNGTAGVWRRQAIEDAGGWQGDTLTEDLDLSYRAQLAGWRFAYLQALEVPAELPGDPRAFKNQQHRWAKGSIQVARKLLPTIWRSDQPLRIKLEASFHLGNNLAYPLMVALLLLLPPALYVRAGRMDWVALAVELPVFIFATLNLGIFYALSERELNDGQWVRRLPLVPFVLGLGASLTPNNARAVYEAAVNRESPFVRTPKAGERAAGDRYRPQLGVQAFVETAAGIYYLVAAGCALAAGLWVPFPFLVLFATAFLILGIGSITPVLAARPKAGRTAAPPAAVRIRPARPPREPRTGRRSTPTTTPGRRAAAGR
jgi:cellulose synthase/poly-beta-1,6-N-acetylglucosamine synthase-like glycosyltransferase